MNGYQRIFGAGPRGTLVSLALLALARFLEPMIGLPAITSSAATRWSVFAATTCITLYVVAWSIRSLPPGERGNSLVTTGAFRFVRHPLYAAFLSSFNLGLAVLLNNWIYVLWVLLLHGVWHWNVQSEEALMRREHPDEYADYCRRTGRFVPRLWKGSAPDRAR